LWGFYVANIIPAASFAQTRGEVGFTYVFAGQQIFEEITEQLDVLASGLVMGVGDLQGTGSDTVRITRYGALGWAEAMVAMAGETDQISPTGYTLGHDSVTTGRYGLAKEQTYTDQILGRAETIGLDDMISMVPMSFLTTLRQGAATIGATFASGAGTSGLAWTYDDELDLIALFHETEGFVQAVQRNGAPKSLRHPEQYSDLRQSIRNEPGLQGSAELQMKLIGLSNESGGGFSFLGIENHASHDVITSGGDHIGCAYVPGAIAWAVASTLPIQVENPQATVWVPEFGIVIERKSTGDIATARFAANAFFGMAKLDAALFPQFKITSIND
jgi:hypothetical protein